MYKYKSITSIVLCILFFFNNDILAQTAPDDDFDGDGILNINDLDDDNDGILDVIEDADCIIFVESFGAGSYPGPPLSGAASTDFIYYDGPADSVFPGGLQDGEYTIAPLGANANGDWPALADHTSEDGTGYAFVVNASVEPSEFYKNTITVTPGIEHTLSAWITNMNDINNETGCIACCMTFVLPDVTIEVRDKLSGAILSSINTGTIPIATPTNNWNNYYLTFNTGTSTLVEVAFINNGPGGCGNDLAIDDIVLQEEPLITNCDFDGDGRGNSMDLDADNDGLYDILEAGGVDIDNNGFPDNIDDADGDGLVDIYDAVCSATVTTIATINAVAVHEVMGYTNAVFGLGSTGFSDTDFAAAGPGTTSVTYDLGQVVPAGSNFDFFVGSGSGSQFVQFHPVDAAGNELGYFGGDNISGGPTPLSYSVGVDVQYIRVRSFNEQVRFYGVEFIGMSTSVVDCSGTLIDPPTETTAGIPDYLSLDSDGDGCADAIEAGFGDPDSDGFIGTSPVVVDGNGVVTGQGGYVGTNSTVTDASVSSCGQVNSITAEEDFNNTPFDTPVTGSVATNDIDAEGNNLTFAPVGIDGGMPATEGAVVLNSNGSYVFTPAMGFVGETEFDYEVCDDGLPQYCTTSTLFIEVFPLTNPENILVIANPDANTVSEGNTGNGNVLSNDLDPDAINPLVTTPLVAMTVDGVDEDGNPITNAGTLTLNPDGTYEFISTPGFIGVVAQPYTICDSGIPATCDDTELVIDVVTAKSNNTFANDDATITDVGVLVPGNVLINDADEEIGDSVVVVDFLIDTDGNGIGDSLAMTGIPTQVGGFNDMGLFVANAGMMTLNVDGTYEFDPAPGFVGNVNIPYTKCDDNIMQACDIATLVITILDVKRDYGDAPINYPVAYHRALTDIDNNEELDGATDVWLGVNTTFEDAQRFDGTASGDTGDDAITFGSDAGQFPLIAIPNTTYSVDIIVNSRNADLVFYGLWIDWDNDGIYEDFYTGSQATASPATATVNITTPASASPGTDVNIRLRADDDPFGLDDFEGGRTNGEVEDYQPLLVLPTALTSFDAVVNNCIAKLEWASESESNFKHYEVQRSIDNISEFETIEVIRGTGSASNAANYSFSETIPAKKNYYRLKMVDLDGLVEYSGTRILETNCLDETEIKIYPNPVPYGQTTVNMKFFTTNSRENFEIRDMSGRKLRSMTLDLVKNSLNIVTFDVTGLVPGTYVVTSIDTLNSTRFIIK